MDNTKKLDQAACAIKTERRYHLDALPLPILRPERGPEKNVHGDLVLKNLGQGYLWSGDGDIPLVGGRVVVRMNGLGAGKVIGYFIEHGWLGVEVKLENAPAWHKQQTKGTEHAGKALVFGAEIDA